MGMPTENTAAGSAIPSIESEESPMMSKYTQKEIERMRMDGYGPTRIAHELGLSVNTVKSHIRRHPSLRNAVYCLQCGGQYHRHLAGNRRNSAKATESAQTQTAP